METKKERMYKRIENHGSNLLKLFPEATIKEHIKLCKSLFRLENASHIIAERQCNGAIEDKELSEYSRTLRMKIIEILGLTPKGNTCEDDMYPIFFNLDARGYSLKISDEYINGTSNNIYKDWGGYGILAPDLREDI